SIKVFSAYRPRRQHGDHVVPHLGEAAVHKVTPDRLSPAKAQLAVSEPADERRSPRQNAQLAVVEGQGHKIDRLVKHGPLGRDHDTLQVVRGVVHKTDYAPSAMRLACSAACSMPPTYMKACSGK